MSRVASLSGMSVRPNAILKTTDALDGIHAEKWARIEHYGDLEWVHSEGDAEVKVLGNVAKRLLALDHGVIFCRGNTKLIEARKNGRISGGGDPEHVHSDGYSNIFVFGEPRNIVSTKYGRVTVVTANQDYLPHSLDMDESNGRVRLIKPDENGLSENLDSSPCVRLENIFPEQERDNPLYVACAAILSNPFRTESLLPHAAKI